MHQKIMQGIMNATGIKKNSMSFVKDILTLEKSASAQSKAKSVLLDDETLYWVSIVSYITAGQFKSKPDTIPTT